MPEPNKHTRKGLFNVKLILAMIISNNNINCMCSFLTVSFFNLIEESLHTFHISWFFSTVALHCLFIFSFRSTITLRSLWCLGLVSPFQPYIYEFGFSFPLIVHPFTIILVRFFPLIYGHFELYSVASVKSFSDRHPRNVTGWPAFCMFFLYTESRWLWGLFLCSANDMGIDCTWNGMCVALLMANGRGSHISQPVNTVQPSQI